MNTYASLLSDAVGQMRASATMAMTTKADELRAAGRDIIGLSAGEPDFDTPEHIQRAATLAIAQGKTKYTPPDGIIELKRALWEMETGDSRLVPWENRLEELESALDPVDHLLAEIEATAMGLDPSAGTDLSQLELFNPSEKSERVHQIRLPDGQVLRGTWLDIVRQMRDLAGFSHEPISQYMKRLAERWHEQRGVEVPSTDPRSFLRAAVQAGLLTLEEETDS